MPPGGDASAPPAEALAGEAASGKKVLLLSPLGSGKTHTLLTAREVLRAGGVPVVFIDLFTAASTPLSRMRTLWCFSIIEATPRIIRIAFSSLGSSTCTVMCPSGHVQIGS